MLPRIEIEINNMEIVMTNDEGSILAQYQHLWMSSVMNRPKLICRTEQRTTQSTLNMATVTIHLVQQLHRIQFNHTHSLY